MSQWIAVSWCYVHLGRETLERPVALPKKLISSAPNSSLFKYDCFKSI